jgi:hypothetical protein
MLDKFRRYGRLFMILMGGLAAIVASVSLVQGDYAKAAAFMAFSIAINLDRIATRPIFITVVQNNEDGPTMQDMDQPQSTNGYL